MTARPLALVRALDDRIAAAFEDGATSASVADLIREAEAASVAAGEASDAARRVRAQRRQAPGVRRSRSRSAWA
jgi:hypothetical protein